LSIEYPWPVQIIESAENLEVAKHPKLMPVQEIVVRTRRAYFDCQFGQLHVRTAFPTTGGFDEQVTLVCLHSREGSSRSFARFMPEIATDRSVYAPDLPGFGESDAAPSLGHADAARAVADLAADLRLRQIDLLGVRFGAAVALDLAAARPELVRRLVLAGAPPMDRIPAVKQQCLILRARSDQPDDAGWGRGTLTNARSVEVSHGMSELFESDVRGLAKQIGGFLKA
jgi:pimeloyl-ACP methyl ester carboxylesterase